MNARLRRVVSRLAILTWLLAMLVIVQGSFKLKSGEALAAFAVVPIVFAIVLELGELARIGSQLYDEWQARHWRGHR